MGLAILSSLSYYCGGHSCGLYNVVTATQIYLDTKSQKDHSNHINCYINKYANNQYPFTQFNHTTLIPRVRPSFFLRV